ncbi:ABC transporter substrate-binding protein [Martelella radicis]|uniref:Sulfonate transport system substrate-binding protein n=1 Tax=Martelella radicis TaxID=1397476 RepID=A0A7W6PCV9_9HYPH|nr:ABC transporter substrate-binding protein [Martelella radicis]MBB4124134.1 sulfonate transport system substrate-binding protein [Martelella radicis]
MRNLSNAFAIAAVSAGLIATPAITAHAEEPAPLETETTLTVGYQKVGHLAPLQLVQEMLDPLNVEIEMVEFSRYADTRTALLAGSLDIATVGPADLPIALAQGSDAVYGIMGVGSSAKYPVVRNGVEMESWDDLAGKKVGIAPGSAVWFQFAATLIENDIPYDSFEAVNIQGGGAAFDQALQRGDVDAIITWEPFESIPVLEGYGHFATNLDYSTSQSVGAELGMMVASKDALEEKRDAVVRFVWAYLAAQQALADDPEAFAEAYAAHTGLDLELSKQASKAITLGSVVTPEQAAAQAKAFAELGVIQEDVSGDIPDHWDETIVEEAKSY